MLNKRLFWKNVVGVKNNILAEELDEHSLIWHLKKGDQVIGEGDTVTEIPFIVSGVLKAVYKDEFGKNRVYCFGYIPGETATSISSLKAGVKAACTIVAVKECTLVCVSLDYLVELVKSNIEVAKIYNRMLSLSLKRGIEHEKTIASYDIRRRYKWFTEVYPGLAEQVSKKDIASYLHMATESFSRILKENL